VVRVRDSLLPMVLVVALAGCNGGGGGGTYITQFPKWDYQSYERIAVAPVQVNDRRAAQAAEAVAYMLVDQLAANGAFTVISYADLEEALTAQDLSRLADVADPSTALPEGRILGTQALVVAKIQQFDLDRERKEIRIPRYARDRKGRVIRDRRGQPRVVREDVIPIFCHRAAVGGTVRVLDAATLKVLVSHRVPPIEVEDKQHGNPPRASPEELAVRAAEEMAVDAYKHIAPIRTKVKLKSKMLAIALDYYEGRYETTKKVPTTLEKFLLVLRDMPKSCDRNAFRVTIAEEEGREYLFEQELVWSGNRGSVAFDVPVSALAATGGEKFVAKLFAVGNPEPILDRDFELVPPEGAD
jgi:hypothetical protein